MEVSLRFEDWNEVDRYADALEAYCQPEPLPRCEFYLARGRALARCGRSGGDDKSNGQLSALRAQADDAGLRAAIPALDAALGSSGVKRGVTTGARD